MRSRSGGSSAVPGARRRGRVVARADETPHRLQFRYWRPVPARKAQLWFLRLADYANRSPSRRVDPIQYVAPSSRYDSLPVSSGHQVGSKTAVPKLSVSASAVLKRFDRARTIFVVILGLRRSPLLARPCGHAWGRAGTGLPNQVNRAAEDRWKICPPRHVQRVNSVRTGAKASKGGAMSDEQRKDEETEVEGHGAFPPKYGANDEPGDEVEAHGAFPPKYGANDEPGDEGEAHGASPPKCGANDEPSQDDEVEGHHHKRS